MLNEFDLNQVRKQRNEILKELVDPKTCEAFNAGTTLSVEWANFRNDLLAITNQDVESVADLVWPTAPQV